MPPWSTSQRCKASNSTTSTAKACYTSAVTLPVAITVTELREAMSGRAFVTAALAAHETGPRVGICMGQECICQGWRSSATTGFFPAASGAARGLGPPYPPRRVAVRRPEPRHR